MNTTLIQGWFRVSEPEPGLFAIAEPSHVEDVKSYLVVGERRALLIDTGTGVGDIGAVVNELTERPLTVVNSHAHWDHVGGNRHFSEVWIHADARAALEQGYDEARMATWLGPDQLRGPLPPGFDPSAAGIPPRLPEGILEDGQVFELGGRTARVIEAPGHARGLIALVDTGSGVLFGTDVVYAGALYAQMVESDLVAYDDTLDKLVELVPDIRSVYSSHGPFPMAPELILAMREGCRAILQGRQPDSVDQGVAEHSFEGFSFLVPAGGDRRT